MVVQLVEMIKRDILPMSTRAPKDFLEKLTAVLNRGSIHSIADHYEGMSNGAGKSCDITWDVCMSHVMSHGMSACHVMSHGTSACHVMSHGTSACHVMSHGTFACHHM